MAKIVIDISDVGGKAAVACSVETAKGDSKLITRLAVFVADGLHPHVSGNMKEFLHSISKEEKHVH
ncbi:hypothetical protein H8I91_21435 [Serratia fonticola]|uniref:hypothetical protein n=1 Tax=Serratia fonticola TaxID=47917 RepID=UPI0016463C56|nr:hypothetical protein [Serratia fonticola]MBC3252831.1 hypothetical protein [Serratia fonticola]